MLKYSFTFTENTLSKWLLHTTARLSSMSLELVSSSKSFEGEQRFYSHYSDTVKCKMNLGVYLPPKVIKDNIDCPVLYFLNGLHSTHDSLLLKSGCQRFAALFGLCIVSPDTSPRNVGIPDHEFVGNGGSFYIDALQEPWAKHFQMHTYVTRELIELINESLPVIKGRQSISGFSMGAYGALNCSLKNPGLYQSVSAFAPVCNPMAGGVVKQVLEIYLGTDTEEWKKWDPSVLAANYSGDRMEIFIDQGSQDEYIEGGHLLPENIIRSSAENDCIEIIFKAREGYDHSYYYTATFVDEHMEYHAKFLNSE